MNKTIKVFISSRFGEFKELRKKIAKEKFSKLDVGLELNMLDYRDSIADARSPAIMSIEEANDSDIFILLLGETYKDVLDDNKSYTHQEYESAIKNNLQILAFPIGDCYSFENRKLSDNPPFREFQKAVLINNSHTTAPFIPSHYTIDMMYDIIYKTLQTHINTLIKNSLKLTKMNSKRVTTIELKQTCTQHYLDNFKTISLLIEDEKKPIDDIYVNLAIIREEKEEDIKDKSKVLDRDKNEEIYKPKEPIAVEELIEKSSKYNSAKALIYGKAGIGKTTFCKYIAYRWAKGELYSEFDNIVYIALREWKSDGLESIVKKIYFEEKHKNKAIEIDQSKTLFFFDGYDELSDTSLLHGAIKKYNLQNYIITSRPYSYRKSDFDVNEFFETIGFTDENVTAYIDKFFEEQSHKTNLQNFLKQNVNIKHIAYIPLMLEMICSLWREKAKSNQSFLSPMTMTELYSEIIEYIFFEYSETNNTAYIQEKEDEIFDYLGKIAFEGLKRQIIVLDKSIIKEKKEFFENFILKTGFLKSDRRHRNPLMNSYEFPHLTFQEYFSALYVSKLSKEEISEVIREYKFYPYMQVFFAFLGGLIEDKEFLLREIESEPRDLISCYEIILISNIIIELKIDNVKSNILNIFLLKLYESLIFFIENDWEYVLISKAIKKISLFLNNNFIDILNIVYKEYKSLFFDVDFDWSTAICEVPTIVIQTLESIFRDNYIVNEILIKFIINEKIHPDMTIELLEALRSENEPLIVEKIKNNYIESLFKKFDKNYINLLSLIEKSLYYNIPLYIKNTKLCTISKNKEIKTDKKVVLNDIEKELIKIHKSHFQGFKEECYWIDKNYIYTMRKIRPETILFLKTLS